MKTAKNRNQPRGAHGHFASPDPAKNTPAKETDANIIILATDIARMNDVREAEPDDTIPAIKEASRVVTDLLVMLVLFLFSVFLFWASQYVAVRV